MMPVSATLEMIVPDAVMAEVHRKNAEVEFQAFADLVAEQFSDARSIELRLLEDPDEDDRCWVVFEVIAARDLTPQKYSAAIKTFYDELTERGPHIPQRICTLQIRFV
jgi:hypothetical protein